MKEDGAVQTETNVNVEKDHEQEPMSDDSEIELIVKKSKTTKFQSMMRDLGVIEQKQNRKSRNHSQQDITIPDGIH